MRLVPIFPLPNIVFYPKVELRLHLFEPRYRQMAADVIEGEGLLVVVLLRQGWEQDYYGNPPVEEIATLGRVTEHELLEDGRYNVVLEGIERVRLIDPAEVSELEGEEGVASDPAPGKLYRTRWVIPQPEERPDAEPSESAAWRLREAWTKLALERREEEPSEPELTAETPLEIVVNRIAHAAQLTPKRKQYLLEQSNILERADSLASTLEEQLLYWSSLKRFRNLEPEDPRLN